MFRVASAVPEYPKSEPHLSPSLIAELASTPERASYYKESIIHTNLFNTFRYAWVVGLSPNNGCLTYHIPDVLSTAIPFLRGQEKFKFDTWLHVAVLGIDLPLALEVIRVGQHVDTKGHTGLTPLAKAMVNYQNFKEKPATTQSSRFIRVGDMLCGRVHQLFSLAQLRKIIILLIEHHAEVNIDLGSWMTPLSCAVCEEDWTLVDLLLIHGANPDLPVHAKFKITQPRLWSRLQTSIQQHYKPHSIRPPRLCPCHSGLPLAQCHDDKGASSYIPYPPQFLCPCQGGETFERCCQKRGVMWIELWDQNLGKLNRGYQYHPPAQDDAQEDQDKSNPFWEQVKKDKDNEDPQVTSCRNSLMVNIVMPVILLHAVKQGKVDPAFSAAASIAKHFPPTKANILSKDDLRERRDKWNAAVDTYIDTHQDSRDTEEIERCAKVGTDCSPLFRHCHAEGCPNYETRKKAFKLCSACRSIKYCSAECQRKDWGTHKQACGTLDNEVLPSQKGFMDVVLDLPVLESLLGEIALKKILSYAQPALLGLCGLNAQNPKGD